MAADMLDNGVYRLRITAGTQHFSAVVVVRDGCMDGGGPASIFQGVITRDGDRIQVKLTVVDWDAHESPLAAVRPTGPPSVLNLSGTSGDGSFQVVGKGRYTNVIEVSGRWVAPLTEPRRT